MKRQILILICCLIASVNVSAQSDSAKPVTRKQLSGSWKSPVAENAGGVYLTREFTFKGDKWLVNSRFYSDAEMTQPLFAFVAEGKYKIQNRSETVQDATNAVFYFSKKSLTLLSADSAVSKRFLFTDCKLKLNVPTDISAGGCSFFTPIQTCGQEYDLVKIKDDNLYLGKRPADRNMCTEDKRPTALALPVTRLK